MNVIALSSLFHDAAGIERRLEWEHPGYGRAFTNLLRVAFDTVILNPRQCSPVEDGPVEPEFREYFISRFNYRLIFAIDGDDLIFVALAHAHKLPGRWTRRWNDARERDPNEIPHEE